MENYKRCDDHDLTSPRCRRFSSSQRPSQSTFMSSEKPLYVTNPEQWLDTTVKGPDLVCIVIFRGSWCKYDKHYLRTLGGHHRSVMKKENVKMIAWTSEGEAGAKKADEEWGLTKDYGYDMVIGDDTNALANWLKEDEILPNLVTKTPEEAKVADLITPGSHSNGIVMAGQAWWAHHGMIAFEWASKFEEPDCGGPGRPEPKWVWEQVLKRKHALDHGNAVMPVHGDDIKMCASDFEVTLAGCSIL